MLARRVFLKLPFLPAKASTLVDGHVAVRRCHPVDWENPTHPLAKREPRKGRRLSLAATIQTPQGPLLCYSCHLEVRYSLLK